MSAAGAESPRRVLIVSSHSLFARGLQNLLEEQQVAMEVVGLVSSVEEAIAALETHQPHLVIVDYDDEFVNRDEFLSRFVGSEGELRVVLLSLKEGRAGQEAVVYDRRTMAASQMNEWLEDWAIPRLSVERPMDPPDLDEPPSRSVDMKHLVAAGFLVIVVTVLVGLVLTPANLLPEAASAQAGPIDALFSFHFWAISFLFSLIVVFMVYSVIVFRRRKGETGDGVHMEGNPTLEVTWTLVPLGVVIGLAFWGSQVLSETQRVASDALPVNVIGQQWSWRFEYPEFDFSSSELVLPVDRQAVLTMSSLDVIHSFWVPEFRLKQDALPGGKEMERDLRVTPSEIGEFKVLCAELCGLQHSEMRADVRVLSQAAFDAWVTEQQTALPDDPAERGRKWSQDFGCIACHSIDGAPGVGPTWQGVWMSEELLEDGSSVVVDAEYIRDSILNPGARIVAGFQNVMPATFGDQLTDEQIDDIIEFIKSLQ